MQIKSTEIEITVLLQLMSGWDISRSKDLKGIICHL